MSREENLLIKQGGKSVSLFGPTYLWNLLKITTLLDYLALLVYLAPESRWILLSNKWPDSLFGSLDRVIILISYLWTHTHFVWHSKYNLHYTNLFHCLVDKLRRMLHNGLHTRLDLKVKSLKSNAFSMKFWIKAHLRKKFRYLNIYKGAVTFPVNVCKNSMTFRYIFLTVIDSQIVCKSI